MNTNTLIATGIFIALLIPVQLIQASALSYVPLDHWSYQAFYRLASVGLIPLHALGARPITRLEAQGLIQQATLALRNADSGVVRLVQDDLKRLSQEFSTESTLEVTFAWIAGNRSTDFIPDRSAGASSVGATFAAGSRFLIFARGVSGGQTPDSPKDELYASFQLGSVPIQLGRTSLWWGPSFRSALLLSDNAGTLPLFRLIAEVPRARLTKVVAFLERSGGSPQGDVVLFATRLDWLVTPQFRLGLSEALVTAWGGPLTFYHLLEPLPVFSGIVASFELHDALGQARNTTAEVDFDWLAKPGLRLYGSFFADDAPERIFERRARVGLLGGGYLADPFGTGRTSLRLEYSAVTNGTYSYPGLPTLEHAYRGRSLGHWLGPDGDDLYVELAHQLDYATNVQVWYAYTRHGSGRIGQPAPPPEDWFLSGIVESRNTLGLRLHRIHSPSLETTYRAEIASVTNQGNLAGVSAWEWMLEAELAYRWPSAVVAGAPSEPVASPEHSADGVPLSPSAPQSAIVPGGVVLRNWSATVSSLGPLAGPTAGATLWGFSYRTLLGTTPLVLSYDGGDGQTFWSADLHYPLAQFEDGTISIFGGWGGVTYRGELGGTIRVLPVSGPRLGAAFLYQLRVNGAQLPLYVIGEISSPPQQAFLGQAPQGADSLSYAWTYSFGAGWHAGSSFSVEAGYRGGAAVWQANTTNKTFVRWDGLYVSVLFR